MILHNSLSISHLEILNITRNSKNLIYWYVMYYARRYTKKILCKNYIEMIKIFEPKYCSQNMILETINSKTTESVWFRSTKSKVLSGCFRILKKLHLKKETNWSFLKKNYISVPKLGGLALLWLYKCLKDCMIILTFFSIISSLLDAQFQNYNLSQI